MARKLPKYRLHKASGRAVLQWKPLEKILGKAEIYLDGLYDSTECVEHFARIRKLLDENKPMSAAERRAIKTHGYCVADLVAEYKKLKGRNKTNTYTAINYLNEWFGSWTLSEFGTVQLIAYRKKLISPSRAVGYINQLVGRVVRVFKWGVQHEMTTAEQCAALCLVEGLQAGESVARVTKKIKPVAWQHVEPVLAKLSPMVAAMVQIHGLAGVRSDEVCGMKESELDRSGDVWIYRKAEHKTAHRGKEKVFCLGPRAQALLLPYLGHGREFIFAPQVSEQERKDARAAARKTPLYGKAKTRTPTFQSIRTRYDSRAYYHTLNYAFVTLANERMKANLGAAYIRETPPKGCDRRAWLKERGVVYWHPHQLRHARATDTSEMYGVEAAQSQLGNTLQATQLYAERSLRLAVDIARETG